MEIGAYVLRVYHKDEFVGYIKNYRKHRNSKYRFNKTRNINKALTLIYKYTWKEIQYKLEELGDKLIYGNNFSFLITEITDQEIRKSKLHLLSIIKNNKKVTGIFKK
jgi:hypothetical protein